MRDISLKELLEAGCHFGHQTTRWNPKMKPYIFAAKEKVHIFDLAKTKEGLDETCAFLKKTASRGEKILLVGTKRQARGVIERVAKEVGMPYVFERWLGGTLTNFEQIQKRLGKLAEMKEKREKGEYREYTKKEQLLFDREIKRLEKFFGGLVSLESLPAVVFIVDVRKEFAAVREATRKGVKIAGIVDTNSDPDEVDYVIPANDDASGSIELIVEAVGAAIKEGLKGEGKEKEKREKKAKPKVKDKTKKAKTKAKDKTTKTKKIEKRKKETKLKTKTRAKKSTIKEGK